MKKNAPLHESSKTHLHFLNLLTKHTRCELRVEPSFCEAIYKEKGGTSYLQMNIEKCVIGLLFVSLYYSLFYRNVFYGLFESYGLHMNSRIFSFKSHF